MTDQPYPILVLTMDPQLAVTLPDWRLIVNVERVDILVSRGGATGSITFIHPDVIAASVLPDASDRPGFGLANEGYRIVVTPADVPLGFVEVRIGSPGTFTARLLAVFGSDRTEPIRPGPAI